MGVAGLSWRGADEDVLMPIDYGKYAADWGEIRGRILAGRVMLGELG
jgi:hypothetical protein